MYQTIMKKSILKKNGDKKKFLVKEKFKVNRILECVVRYIATAAALGSGEQVNRPGPRSCRGLAQQPKKSFKNMYV